MVFSSSPLSLDGLCFWSRIKDRLNQETVIARIGHVYKSYDERYYYWLELEFLKNKLHIAFIVCVIRTHAIPTP